MNCLKNHMKQTLLMTFSSILIAIFSCIPAHASNTGQAVPVEMIDLSTIDYTDTNLGISSTDEDDYTLTLKSGNYEKWIDRANFPDYAQKFYDTLVEYCDNDGIDDLMIVDEGYARNNAIVINYGGEYGSDIFQGIKYTTLKNPTDEEMNYVFKTMRAVYDAFDMDHPEVFWPSGTSWIIINRMYTSATDFEDTYYFLIKLHEGSYQGTFDIREEKYQSESAIKAEIAVRDAAVESILNTDEVKNASNDYETVKALNHWLTHNNEYNWTVIEENLNKRTDAHKCIGALTGGKDHMRPVCEGFSKAMKVLCDAANIPCVITTGNAYGTPGAEPEPHSWNIIQIDGVWYPTDVTWNDPAVTNNNTHVSGYENEDYLLVGNDTLISGITFAETHVAVNNVSTSGLSFINGPILSSEKYVPESTPETPTVEITGVTRIAGATRYETSLAIADQFKIASGQEQFTTVIVANGKNFADALAGSYLASVKNAPILMTNGKNLGDLKDYILENLVTGGTIYLLGGDAAVPEAVENALAGLGTIIRLAGDSRYDTNLEILKEAGVGDEDIFVCTGKNFADSLSASAAKKPILLVNNKVLSDTQKTFLEENVKGSIYIIGGEGAVNATIEEELSVYGKTERISGSTRYETSVLFAQKFFESPKHAVLASAKNFPDGLCGGALAMSLDAPLILTADGKVDEAVSYMSENGISTGFVLGGDAVISDESANLVFGLNADTELIY